MKTLKLILILSLSAISAYCQEIDYNKIIIPAETNVSDFSEKLVQLAWNNHPSNQIILKDYEIAKVSLSQAKWTWMDQISASGNLNEFTLNPDQNLNTFFPRYNFGVTIPLGIFLNVPTNTKIAQRELEKVDLEIKQQKLLLRNQVLKAYQNFLMYEQILKLKSELLEDERSTYLTVEAKFENGEISLTDYKDALKDFNAELEEHIKAKNSYENAKLELELYIGLNLEEII
jgi:outer membrane protein TolC